LIFYLRKSADDPFPFRRKALKEFFHTGLPLVPSALMAWALLSVDRYLLNLNHGSGQVGIYSTAMKFASILNS